MISYEQRRFTSFDQLVLVGDTGGPPEAPAVVLLHGGGQTRHSWASAMGRLVEEGYHVVNYDARGHGESEWSPAADYSISAYAGDLAAVMATVRGPVALVGASLGGMTSFYAIGAADRLIATALVMVDITLRPAQAGADKIMAFMSAHVGGFRTVDEAVSAVAAYNPQRPRPADPSGLRRNLRLQADGRLYWHWDPRMLEVLPTPEPPAFTDELIRVSANVTLPTLLVRGGKSDIVDDDGVAEMCRLVPQTEIYDVHGAGHMVAGDKNDAFNDGVMSFLQHHHPAR